MKLFVIFPMLAFTASSSTLRQLAPRDKTPHGETCAVRDGVCCITTTICLEGCGAAIQLQGQNCCLECASGSGLHF